MNRLKKALIFALLAQGALAAHSSQAKDASVRYEVLLNGKLLDDARLQEKFIGALDITSSRLILLSTNDRFYLLGWGGIEPVGQRVAGTISSFAYSSDGFLMIVRDRMISSMDPRGNLSTLFGLPDKSMGIGAGKHVMYVYDREKGRRKNALYVLAKGGKYAKLFEIPTPISAVVEINNTVVFATGSALFVYNIKNKEIKPLFALPKDKEIVSIAVDASSSRIYFSTAGAFYALNDDGAVIVSDKLGGVLRYFDDGLIVFDPDKRLLMRITGLSGKVGIAE